MRVGQTAPLASLAGRAMRCANFKTSGAAAGPIQVRFADGVYALTQPVDFTAPDSGTEAGPVLYDSARRASRFSRAGRVITGWKQAADGVWDRDRPRGQSQPVVFRAIVGQWTAGDPGAHAQQFYYYMLRKLERGLDPLTGQEADLSSRAILGRKQDLAPLFRLPKERLRDVTAVVYHAGKFRGNAWWGRTRRANLVVASAGAPWAFFNWSSEQRYHLENFREALDAPGEWFLDRDGTLSYLPRPGEDMTRAEVVAPLTDQFRPL